MNMGLRLGLKAKLIIVLSLFVLLIMGLVIEFVRRQQSEALDHEMRERGKALARAVAASSAEPISLGTEATLLLMQTAQGVIQRSEDPEALERLSPKGSFAGLVMRNVADFGRPKETIEIQNEGVLFAKLVGPDGKVMAAADVSRPKEEWINELGETYYPDPGTGLISEGEKERTWDSYTRGGMIVIGVPIYSGDARGDFLGGAYLGMSKETIRRAIATAVSKLLLVAIGGLAIGILIAVVIAARLVNPVQALSDAALAVGLGDYNRRVDIRRSDELGELASAFNEMAQGLGERELIRNAFGAYVSYELLADILSNPEAMKIGGAKRTVTMVDSDIRGFTSMSAALPPEEVVSVVNAYLDIQTQIIRRYKGHIDRFVGDEILAVFGVPEEDPDDAERAVRCAWEIKNAVAAMIKERQSKGLPAPRIGIGVDTGTVIAGNMGAQGVKLEYAVVGEPVGSAHELVDLARDESSPGGQVIISEDTLIKIKEIVQVRELEALPSQGMRGGRKAYELLEVKAPYLLVMDIASSS